MSSSSGLSRTVSAQSRRSVFWKGSLGCLLTGQMIEMIEREYPWAGRAEREGEKERAINSLPRCPGTATSSTAVQPHTRDRDGPAARGVGEAGGVGGGLGQVGVLAAGLAVAHLGGEGSVHGVDGGPVSVDGAAPG